MYSKGAIRYCVLISSSLPLHLATVHDNAILQNVSGLIFFNCFTYYTDVMMFMLIYICTIILWVCVCASKQFEKILMTLPVPVGVYFS